MKILFLLANMHSPYEGVVRPFINWAKELARNNYEVYFVTLGCGTRLVDFIHKLASHGINHEKVRNISDIVDYVKKVKPYIVMTDDSIDRLRLITKVKNLTGVRTAIYVQVLFGVHSIAEVFDPRYLSFEEKLKYSIVRLIPFTMLKKIYRSKLLKHDVLIANSKATASLLSILYGIEPHGIVYPPVDTNIFRPCNIEKQDQVLLYLGSHAGDTEEELIRHVVRMVLEHKDIHLVMFGNRRLASRLMSHFNENRLHLITGVTDNELARIYSMSKVTVCPQKWEQFGYVVAESISCGTPVIAYNAMGPAEIIEMTSAGILVNRTEELFEVIKDVDAYVKPIIETIKRRNDNIYLLFS